MKRLNVTVTCAVLLTLASCEGPPRDTQSDEAGGPEATETPAVDHAERFRRAPGIDYIMYPDEPMRPAHRRTLPTPSAKADQYDDIRAAAPQRYAITAPPSGDVRPMVEWEPMRAVVMAVPDYLTASQYENARGTILQIAKHASTVAEVWFIVPGNSTANTLKNLLQQVGVPESTITSKIRFIVEPLDSVWFIDSGPLPIIDQATDTFSFADFRYYHDRPLDDGLPTFLGRALPELGQEAPTNTYRMPVTTEGGTFQATTDGVCFTGSRQLYYMSCDQGGCDSSLNSADLATLQDHPLTQQLEAEWGDYLGCQDVVITYSITDDGTGHIDMYMKVVDDDTIIIGHYPEPYANSAQQTNAARMDANTAFLESYVKPGGGGFTVERVVMPGHRTTINSRGKPVDVPFTYINSTFVNGLNLWPAYSLPENDDDYQEWEDSRAQAQAEWEAAMPDYDHVWIDSEELSFWSGAIHCVTRTVPAKAPDTWIDDGTCVDGTCQAPTGGYDGACQPGGASQEVCWGPAWECGCNDCTSSCPTGGTSECGDVTYTGCCDGSTAIWCDNGSLQSQECTSSCGWDAEKNYYYCGESGEDPSGEYPRSCDGGCTPDCSGKTCGDDGCGGSCGTCAEGETCSDGQCHPPCGDVTFTGCCDGSTVVWCEDGLLYDQDCESSCGWDGDKGFYECGDTGADPSGENPLECEPAACEPACDGKVCGPDGCGGSCGSCAGDEVCTETGQCEPAPCEPACDGKTCGDDGCGASCGTCADGEVCEAGQCEPEACEPACDGKTCGDDGCGASCGTCADGEVCEAGQCEPEACEPACDGKTCGDDGCGEPCGACADGEICEDFACVPEGCVPDCVGKQCGPDGCGGLCAPCHSGFECTAEGICEPIPCDPDCSGKACGDDGCGGSCGACADGEACDAGQCEAVEGCGDVSFEGYCDGSTVIWCEDDQVKSFDCTEDDKVCGVGETGRTCVEPCVPDCSGKQCGDDGCGGSCGACPPDSTCDEARQCVEATDPSPDAEGGTPDAGDDVSEPDAAGSDDTAGGQDVSGSGPDTGPEQPPVSGGGDGGSSGCAGGGGPTGALPWALLLLPALVATRRRRAG
ncbi:MAG: agmatine deiminase family protein [Myxococcota bacterium]